MTAPELSRRGVLLALAALAAAQATRAVGATPELPGASVYQLKPVLADQDGHAFEIGTLRGQPVLVSMFYSSCEKVCPMIFETIRLTLKALPPAQAERVKVLMVSFDPARDTVAVLKKTADAHGCDARWTLARGSDADVRKLAALLGVQYRRLASGEFNHSSSIELLDSDGRIAGRSGTLGAVDPALLKALQLSLAKAA